MKKVNKIIIGLSIVLTGLITYSVTKFNIEKQETINHQQVQMTVNKQVSEWEVKQEMLRNELTRINKLAVLQGEIEVKKTFSNTQDEINYKGNSNSLKWLSDKLNTMKTKEITVQTTYQYNFLYELDKSRVYVNPDGSVEVSVHIMGVSALPVAELPEKRVISNSVGFLSQEFTPQEVSAIMLETSSYAQDLIIHDNTLYYKSLENAKTDLEELMKTLGVENVKFIIHD